MSITEEQSNEGANIPLHDWNGNKNYSSPTEGNEIDSNWAEIAQLSKEHWGKENPF